MTREELLACPFCGAGTVELHETREADMAWVSCTSCGLEAPSETGTSVSQAISYWNRRGGVAQRPLQSIHDAVNALGGSQYQDNSYDQAVVDTVAKALEIIERAQGAGVAQEPAFTIDLRSALQLLDSLDRIAEDFRKVQPCRHNNDNVISELKIELAGLREVLAPPQYPPGHIEHTEATTVVSSTPSPAVAQQPPSEPVAWLDIRTSGLSWQNRIVATNPQFVENNGPENFVALYAAPQQSPRLEREAVELARFLKLAQYDDTIAKAKDDGALSDTGRNIIIDSCLASKSAVVAFAAAILALLSPDTSVVSSTSHREVGK